MPVEAPAAEGGIEAAREEPREAAVRPLPSPPPPATPPLSLQIGEALAESMLASQQVTDARILDAIARVQGAFVRQYQFGDTLQRRILEGHTEAMGKAQVQLEALQAAVAAAAGKSSGDGQ